MSGGADSTYHTSKEELKKAEAKEADRHGGKIPKDSDVSQLKVRYSKTALYERGPGQS